MPQFSIIILSYNTKELLQRCLDSLSKVVNSNDAEIIVVDNASTDGSAAMVKENYKGVHLVINGENAGFAKGNNKGVKEAKGEYLLFLNSDTLIQALPLDEVAVLFQNPKVGVIGGEMRNPDNSLQRSYGRFYSVLRVARMLLLGDRVDTFAKGTKKEILVDWVSGGYMFVKKELFLSLGGFDEQFFMYIEDMELCYRVKKAGIQVLFYPRAVVSHMGHGSSNRTFAIVQIYKGLLYFFRKHRYYGEYVTVRLLLVLKAITLIFLGTITGNNYLVTTYKKALASL